MSKQVDFLCSDLTLEMTQENRELLLSHSLCFYFTLGIYEKKMLRLMSIYRMKIPLKFSNIIFCFNSFKKAS